MTINSGGTVQAKSATGALGVGPTTLDGGTLQLRHTATATFNSSVLVTDDSTINVDRATGTTTNLTLSLLDLTIGANTLTLSGNAISSYDLAITGTTTLNGAARFDVTTSGCDATLAGGIAQDSALSSLTKTGAGVLKVTDSGSYTGGTTIEQGELRISVGDALGSNSITLVGGTLGGNGTVTVTNAVQLQANSFVSAETSSSLKLTSAITETASYALTKTGAGTVVLANAANNFTRPAERLPGDPGSAHPGQHGRRRQQRRRHDRAGQRQQRGDLEVYRRLPFAHALDSDRQRRRHGRELSTSPTRPQRSPSRVWLPGRPVRP